MNIDGVTLTPLLQIKTEHGVVSRMLRSTDHFFTAFGEIYFSSVPAGSRKDWRLHRSLTMHLCVPVGMVRFVLIDTREASGSRGELLDLEIGVDDHQLLTVPKGVWMSFENRRTSDALVANCATEPHSPTEVVRRTVNDPPLSFDW